MKSIHHLKTQEHERPEELSFIPKLSVRQEIAVSVASEEAERQRQNQQSHAALEQSQELDPHQLDDPISAADGSHQVLLDDDTESIDDDNDDDGAWVPGKDDLVPQEFDSRLHPSEDDTEQESNDSEVLGLPETSFESIGKQIQRLFTVVKVLVHSPHIARPVRNKDVEMHCCPT